MPVVIDFERFLVEDEERVLQLNVTVDVARKRLGSRVLHPIALAKSHDLGILGRHVDKRVGGNALSTVCKPLEQVGIAERAHANRPFLVVDLAVEVADLELADVIGDGAHLAIAQQNR